MISKRIEINRSCNSVNYPTMAVIATSAIKVTNIGVNVQSTRSQTELDNGAVSTIEIIVQFNGQNISSGAIQMTTTDRHDEFFTLPNGGLVVEVGQTFNIVCPYVYCHAYAQNDGYPYPSGTDPTVFTELEKDSTGYPKNWSAWKYDNNNEGYPWLTGFLPMPSKIDILLLMDRYYHKVNEIYAHDDSDLVPVKVKVNINPEDS